MPQPAPSLDTAQTILEKVWFLSCPSRADIAREARKELKGKPYRFPLSTEYWEAYRNLLKSGRQRHENLEKAMRVKDVRTDSGVAPITVLTKPYPCPGRCVYCPTEARMPKSYISSEPAAARALSLQFDPFEQVTQRVQTLERHGHQADKIELIIKGGTWSAYDKEYREWFITRCFEAANELGNGNPLNPLYQGDLRTSLVKGRTGGISEVQKTNENAGHRIIGLTIETRPDWINPEEVIHLRKLGVTRVELGLQIINDRVLGLTKRGTTVADAERAIALLKTAGFKVDVHILPGQPGATPEDDLESFRLLFGDPRFRPDMVKLYPCVVMPGSELQEWMEQGQYEPLQGEPLKELLITMLSMVPRYCRVPRVVRDFPTQDIAAGNKESNLREDLESAMKKRGLSCVCLRCREVGHVIKPSQTSQSPASRGTEEYDVLHAQTRVFEERYENAGGTEVFLSVEDEDRKAVFGFCRLRLPGEISLNPSLARGTCNLMRQPVPNDQKLKEMARAMRNSPTSAEEIIWKKLLSDDKTGYRFLRQKPLGHFIVDFYCSELLLAIEVDGSSHDDRAVYDEERTNFLSKFNIKVLRFSNDQILNSIANVEDEIKQKISKRYSELNTPLSKGVGGISEIYQAFPILRGAAIIRELHTYGTALKIDAQDPAAAQHKGYGRLLMQTAEDIALREGCPRIAVISGIGVREYYKTLGYTEKDTYMVKEITKF